MTAFAWVFLALITSAQAAVLSVTNPRFTISASDANQLRSEPLSLRQKPETLSLGSSDVLKLTFQVVTADKGEVKGFQPHQTFLRFYDKVSGEEGIQPVKVTAGGKAKFELNMARPPTSLPPTSDSPLEVSLFVGSFKHAPVQYELFDLVVPASQPPPQHPDEPTFHPRPEIHHTFRPEQKVPAKAISGVFSILVLAPWVALLGMWAHIRPQVPHLFSPPILSFITTLGAFEALLFWYWVDLKLGQVLLYGAILSVPTLIAGQQALSALSARRSGKAASR